MLQETIEIGEDILLNYWQNFFPDDSSGSFEQGEDIFFSNFQVMIADSETLTPLFFKPKAWKLTIGKNLFNNAVNTSLVSAIMYMVDYRQLPTTIVTGILVSLFQIERITISKEDEAIHLNLPIKKKYRTPEEYYESLPGKIRKNVNELAFQDLMEKFVLAGLALKDKEDDNKYLIVEKKNCKVKFHIF